MSPLGFVAEGRSLIGSYLGSAVPARDIPRFVSLWREGRLPVEALVSSTIDLDRINEGMDELADGRAVRQIIEFAALEPGGAHLHRGAIECLQQIQLRCGSGKFVTEEVPGGLAFAVIEVAAIRRRPQ